MTKQPSTNVVPTLDELYADKASVIKQSKLNIILNAEPKPEWVKIHPMTKQKYMPIERIEYLLTMIFGSWEVEIKSVSLIANSVVAVVRVHVRNPITRLAMFQDGVGAVPIQIKKDSGGAIDFANMNAMAIQIGAPSAESYAFKDAAEKFGKIFGKDINRKDNVQYVDRIHSMIASMSEPDVAREVVDAVRACTTEKALKAVYEANRGLGKDFDRLVADQKMFIESIRKQENAGA